MISYNDDDRTVNLRVLVIDRPKLGTWFIEKFFSRSPWVAENPVRSIILELPSDKIT